MTAQEDLTGMPTPKQDERTPVETLPWVSGRDPYPRGIFGAGDYLIVPARGLGPVAIVAGEHYAAFIVQACNTYGSTDALRSALVEGRQAAVELASLMREGAHDKEEIKWCKVVDRIDAALAGVTAPEPDIIEELIIAAYKRGFHWCVENASDPEAAAYVGKAARDYADKTMNASSAGVTAPSEVDAK